MNNEITPPRGKKAFEIGFVHKDGHTQTFHEVYGLAYVEDWLVIALKDTECLIDPTGIVAIRLKNI